MEVKVVSKFIRVSPRKARPLVRELQGLEVDKAIQMAKFVHRGISEPVYKILQSAKANATIKNPDIKKMFVKKLVVDSGPTLKRMHPISRGRAGKILKRTCHLTVVLSDDAAVVKGVK